MTEENKQEHLNTLEKIDEIIKHCISVEAKEKKSGLSFYLDRREFTKPQGKFDAVPSGINIHESEAQFIRNLMVEMGFIDYKNEHNNRYSKYKTNVNLADGSSSSIDIFYLKAEGYKHAHKIAFTVSNEFFVARKFDDDVKDTWKKVKQPLEEKTEFRMIDLQLSKEAHHNNNITFEIIAQIKKSKFLIADYTYNSPNVYWEAGFAHGLGKEVIPCCKDEESHKENIRFDVKQFNFIYYKDANDLAKQLKDRINGRLDS